MTDEEIRDIIRHSTDSAIQALTNLVESVIVDNRNHRQEEAAAREEHRQKLMQGVQDVVIKTVNGKIDAIKAQMLEDTKIREKMAKQLDTLSEKSNPLINQFEERKGFRKTISSYSKNVGLVAGLIAGSLYIVDKIINISK